MKTLKPNEIQPLWIAAVRGNLGARNELVEGSIPMIYTIVTNKYPRFREITQDIAQTTAMLLLTHLKYWKPEKIKYSTFVGYVVMQGFYQVRCSDPANVISVPHSFRGRTAAVKEQAKRVLAGLVNEPVDGLLRPDNRRSGFEVIDQRDTIECAMQSLTARERMSVQMTAEGYTGKAIAKKQGCALGTVQQRNNQAYTKMRKWGIANPAS